MSMKLDINNFVSSLKKADDVSRELPDYIYTEGEEYLYRNVIEKCISGEKIYANDIDFEAFDEDEIVSLIDDKGDEIYNGIYLVSNIINTIEKSPAMTVSSRRFF